MTEASTDLSSQNLHDDGPEAADAAEADGLGGWTQVSGAPTSGDGLGLGDSMSQRDISLKEHLADQLKLLRLDLADRAVATMLIDGVDDGGYLRLDASDVAVRLGCGTDKVEQVLALLQGMEPVGVFARDVRECLRLQMVEKDRLDPAMEMLIDNLNLLARRDLVSLKRICAVDDEDLHEMIAEIRSLTPRPGAAFGSQPVEVAVPEITVTPDRHGGWRIELNTDALPRVLLDRKYQALVAKAGSPCEDKVFISECLASANWLIKSIDQRARTILSVSSEIVRQQDMFLAHGIEHLRPLTLREVADAIGVHESTVSRATANKYIETPRGIFELKYFFTVAIASSDGAQAHSAAAVRHRIRQMIETERDDAKGMMTDERLAETLGREGVRISRRTIVKYRAAMRIPGSAERRRGLD